MPESVSKTEAKVGVNNGFSLNVKPADKTEKIDIPQTITKGKFSINGKEIDVNPEKDTVNDILAKINSADAGVTAYIAGNHIEIAGGAPVKIGAATDTSNFLQAVGLKSTTKQGDLATVTGFKPVTLAAGKDKTDFGSITINGVEINVGEVNNAGYTNRTAADYVANKINEKASETNVNASVDRQNRLVLTQTQTGEKSIIKIDTKIGAMGIGSGTTKGTDNIIRGVVNILSNDISIRLTPDMKFAIEKIKEFVDIFNTVGNTILEMTKKGELLANDPTAIAIRDKIKAIPEKEVKDIKNGINTLAAAGIAFGKGDETDFLNIDNNKLMSAITNTPENVTDIFNNSFNLLKDAITSIDNKGRIAKAGIIENNMNKLIIEQQLNKEKALLKQMRVLNQGSSQLQSQKNNLDQIFNTKFMDFTLNNQDKIFDNKTTSSPLSI